MTIDISLLPMVRLSTASSPSNINEETHLRNLAHKLSLLMPTERLEEDDIKKITECLYTSQTAGRETMGLSARVQDLNQQIAAFNALWDRVAPSDPSSVSPDAVGDALREKAQELLESLRGLVAVLQGQEQEARSSSNMTLLLQNELNSVLARWLAEHPRVALQIEGDLLAKPIAVQDPARGALCGGSTKGAGDLVAHAARPSSVDTSVRHIGVLSSSRSGSSDAPPPLSALLPPHTMSQRTLSTPWGQSIPVLHRGGAFNNAPRLAHGNHDYIGRHVDRTCYPAPTGSREPGDSSISSARHLGLSSRASHTAYNADELRIFYDWIREVVHASSYMSTMFMQRNFTFSRLLAVAQTHMQSVLHDLIRTIERIIEFADRIELCKYETMLLDLNRLLENWIGQGVGPAAHTAESVLGQDMLTSLRNILATIHEKTSASMPPNTLPALPTVSAMLRFPAEMEGTMKLHFGNAALVAVMAPFPTLMEGRASGNNRGTGACTDDGHRQAKKKEPGDGRQDDAVQKMILIPAGPILLGDLWQEGSPEERPYQIEQLPEFWMAMTPVTNAQFAIWVSQQMVAKQVYLQHPGRIIDRQGHLLARTIEVVHGSQLTLSMDSGILQVTPIPGKEHHPVVHVSWKGAMVFSLAHGLVLPTEGQWERAASMVPAVYGEPIQKWRYAFSSENASPAWANYGVPRRTPEENYSTPVGFFDGVRVFAMGKKTVSTRSASSPWGCKDMSGNVWEWTLGDDSDAGLSKIVKGGSYADDSWCLRTSAKKFLSPDTTDACTGFRIASRIPL